MASPVAVCTLGSRSLLQHLAGRPEIAVAGRVFTENVGIERMIQNLVGMTSLRYLIVCGRETRHHVGQTIVALHTNGLDQTGRVVGSNAPTPVMPNLTAEQLNAFQTRVGVVDLIGETDVAVILERARACAAAESADPTAPAVPPPTSGPPVERIRAIRDPQSAWVYDPAGYFLVFVDRAHHQLRAEQYSQEHQLLRIIEGTAAEEIGHTVVRLGLVTLLAHAAYLGRELARAETALRLGLDYEQDRPLSGRRDLQAEH
jgi:tetrahydromethanopterin S-methyltransferase subunit A